MVQPVDVRSEGPTSRWGKLTAHPELLPWNAPKEDT
jgi:hypothetical protein